MMFSGVSIAVTRLHSYVSESKAMESLIRDSV